MSIVDVALRERLELKNPVRVGMVGAGFMAKGIVLQIEKYTPGMTIVGICNRSVDKGRVAFREAGVHDDVHEVGTVEEMRKVRETGGRVVTSNISEFCKWESIEVILEVTGTIEYASNVCLEAIKNGKHVVNMNAELDGTIGPILKRKADKAKVVYSNSDGDQPGVLMNLYRFVKAIGIKPVLCGNIKGFHNVYRTPETQAEFARATKQAANMVTSFCDGTKVTFEMAVVANACGMRVAKRGMHGPTLDAHIDEAHKLFKLDEMLEDGGLVDYVVLERPNKPAPGVFVVGYLADETQAHYLRYYKMGDGPLYTFYTPYHLCHLEVPQSCARAVLFSDAVCAPLAGPRVDCITAAKRDLKAGEVLDGIGMFMTYGLAENSSVVRTERLLPMGLSEGCRLVRDIAKDQIIAFADVQVPEGRLCDQLWKEQNDIYFPDVQC